MNNLQLAVAAVLAFVPAAPDTSIRDWRSPACPGSSSSHLKLVPIAPATRITLPRGIEFTLYDAQGRELVPGLSLTISPNLGQTAASYSISRTSPGESFPAGGWLVVAELLVDFPSDVEGRWTSGDGE